MARTSVRRWTTVVLVNIVLLALVLGGGELYLRHAYPCDAATNAWQWQFLPGVGEVYQPHSLVRQTNRFDFCVEQRANSMGLLDREPPPFDAVKDKLRVALIGDSVIEATQVPPADKMQIQLERMLGARGIDAYVSAYGISGLGQVQELALFEKFGLALHPQIVVLIIVGNDLKNNSWLLQAIEDGVSPETPYNVEIRPPDWTIVPPVPFGQIIHLPAPAAQAAPAWRGWLTANSVLYGFLVYLADYNWPRARYLLTGVDRASPTISRVEHLSRDPALAPLLVDWPRDPKYVDAMSNIPDLERRPPAFDLAIRATEHVMDQWSALARREGFKLVALIRSDFDELPAQARMWRRILDERGIATIWYSDLYDGSRSHFLRDGHWNAQGHRWAAEAVARSPQFQAMAADQRSGISGQGSGGKGQGSGVKP